MYCTGGAPTILSSLLHTALRIAACALCQLATDMDASSESRVQGLHAHHFRKVASDSRPARFSLQTLQEYLDVTCCRPTMLPLRAT